MKTQLLAFAFTIASLFSFAQTNNRFYATLEDYKNNKFIEGYEISSSSWRMTLGSESFEVKQNGTSDRKKLSALPSDLFKYNNCLMRRYEGHCYYVLVAGHISYYILKNEAEAYGNNNVFMIAHIPNFNAEGKDVAGNPDDYYSETINGEIKKLKNKTLEAYLTQHNLLSDFEKDKPKREFKDSKDSYTTKEVNRIVKYLVMINEKLK